MQLQSTIIAFVHLLTSVSTFGASERLPRQNNETDVDIDPRIIGGKPLSPGNYIKHQLHYSFNGELECGATLAEVYGVQIALTATHCLWSGYPDSQSLFDAKGYLVTAGDRDLTAKDHEQTSRVAKIVAHPYYDPNYYTNDIAIMFLETPFKDNEWIEPIVLPGPDWPLPSTVKISGWGSKKFAGPVENILTWTDIPVVPDDVCESYNNRRPLWVEINTKQQFCVGEYRGGRQYGSCTGDSGGGGVGWNDNTKKFYLAGIISFGTSLVCGHPYLPTVYTRMTFYADWVRIEVSKYLEGKNGKK